MIRYWKTAAIALLAIVIWAPAASARGLRGDGDFDDFVRPSFQVYYGPEFFPGWYGLVWWYDPWYEPYWGPAYHRMRNVGEVEIITKHKGDSIYVDGGYAGRTGKLKKFPLRAGLHTIKLRDPSGHTFYQERIDVIRGKTLKIRPDYSG